MTTSKKEEEKTSWPAIRPIAVMEKAFDRLFGRSWPSLWRRNETPLLDNMFEFEGQRLPSLDVIDRDSEYLVRAEIPGIDKKDINISLTDNLLTIKGQASSEKKEEKGTTPDTKFPNLHLPAQYLCLEPLMCPKQLQT